ncbi:DUF4232 domain-containing protein [Streptomyces sp. NPDC048723]|uniref:DUF4232 domain-containing protein n=1 Tax=Streptomyces sp. NPDC048723 TaxID=3365589 RepID=UPI00371F5B4B
MITERWVRGVVGGAVAAGMLAGAAGCETPPAPKAAPGPTEAPRKTPTPHRSPTPPNPNPTPTAPASPAAPEPAPEPCPEGGVRLVEGSGDAVMGLRLEGYRLVNCGTDEYVLEGYPQVRLLDKQDQLLEVAIGHGSAPITSEVPAVDAPPERVTLAPGQTASMALLWRDRITDVTVPPVEGWVLEVTPKPGAPRLGLRLTRPVDLGNTGQLGVGPWKR